MPIEREPWSLVDPETGVPDGRFFELAVESHVLTAKRQLWPMSVVLLEVKPWDDLRRVEVMGGFVQVVRQTLRDADVLCRLGPSSFGVVLDDTTEAGGVGAAERVQAASADEGLAVFAVVAGVASYPAHGLEASDILFRARAALARARAAAAEGASSGGVAIATVDPA
jgi:diguanylate cyclase (GGDEF)-like protein